MTATISDAPPESNDTPSDAAAGGGLVGVTLGTLQFNTGRPDATGVELVCSDLEGWHDTPDIDGEAVQYPDRHGGWVGPGLLAPRQLTLTGWVLADTDAACTATLSALHRAAPLAATGTLAVAEPPEPRMVVGLRRAGQIKVGLAAGGTCAQVQVPLVAGDPRLYAVKTDQYQTTLPLPSGQGLRLPLKFPLRFPPRPRGGFISPVNRGSIPAPFTAVITGPCENPRITDHRTGAYLGVTLVLAERQRLVIDTGAMTALLDGQESRAGMVAPGSSWLRLAPGTSDYGFTATPLRGQTVPPTLTLTTRSAWS